MRYNISIEKWVSLVRQPNRHRQPRRRLFVDALVCSVVYNEQIERCSVGDATGAKQREEDLLFNLFCSFINLKSFLPESKGTDGGREQRQFRLFTAKVVVEKNKSRYGAWTGGGKL